MPRELTLREIQQRLLEIAKRVTAWMEENGINYSLSGGTLLGAIRHDGFIPWDDDIDICIPRPDYQRMIALMRAGKCEIEGLRFGYPGMKGHYFSAVKFLDSSTRVVDPFYGTEREKDLWIDIFPMDRLPAEEATYKRHVRTFLTMRYMLWTCCTPRDAHVRFRGKSWKRKLRWNAYRSICAAMGGYRSMARLIDLHSRWIDWRNRKGCRWGNITWTSYLEDYADMPGGFRTIFHDFEGERFRVMEEYDAYLTVVYGNYMTPPPPEKRQTHDTRAFAVE